MNKPENGYGGPAIIVHGGAHPVPEGEEEQHCLGCFQAASIGWAILKKGGSALDAVEAAVRSLEDKPTFNAGTGSELNANGVPELDAAIMEGTHLNVGGVGAIQGVLHPVSVARQLLEREPTLLVGDGARRFAEEAGTELCASEDLITEKQRRKWEEKSGSRGHDTVGAVALDRKGCLAVATSTGGTNQNLPGRIGDSPLIGCGFYADDEAGACALSGDGESIARIVLAKTIVEALRQGEHPDFATTSAMQLLENRVGGEGGGIAIDAKGRIGWAHNAPNLPCAYMKAGMNHPAVFLSKAEEKKEIHHGK